MNLDRVVTAPGRMRGHCPFHRFAIEIGPVTRSWIKQNVLDVTGQLIPVVHAEVMKLVTPQEKPLDSHARDAMIDLRQPLRHTIVVRVFSFEAKLSKKVKHACNAGDRTSRQSS